MGLFEFIFLLLVAGVCGSIGQSIAGSSKGGCVVSIVLGFIGALIGSWLSRTLNLPELFTFTIGGESFPVIWSIIGSVVFVTILSLLTGRK
ncbi:MAG: GlsB/YeaQ/YmgE family stress response membrane protein [Candidatus Cyclonatronum sp.]|uniref:GlsB/YeaQ/YmgE family stress response membrane protein n=1 Tax=Cyclonatronum sp. TaxID=3024185 RepID=UPI0025C52211|nr:GlsB/YeaQ/YmgE family stress response membrane protein [Cyclonatronum sp.]MCC5933510.1 GlsB/YeaQ/YmgE family stress response membrane protein [Balneolales bacterium]MCH8486508.1 GlsB/YeaQ/YmgE family stress response membrane protein [Cyclonatronum sp.]